MNTLSVEREGRWLKMPAWGTAHSHAFQRALRGRTQRPLTDADSFWSWRGLMYRLAEQITPEDMYHLARFAYIELALAGVGAIGEFHYLHHDMGGKPYRNRLAMAEGVIEAARDAGIRICLIRTAYQRGGYQQELTLAQQRFSDDDLTLVMRDTQDLQARYQNDPQVTVGVAAHSIRAVPKEGVITLAQFAREQDIPFHMHVAEQRRELAECETEYGMTPVALLAEAGVLSSRFVGVHATHLSAGEIQALGDAQAMVCLCRTTERDLGDGAPQTSELIRAGVRLCVGVDSHCAGDAFEEVRAVELDERVRTEKRVVATTALALLQIGTEYGYVAMGMGNRWQEDTVWLDGQDASLAGILEDELLVDSVIFGGTARAVREVVVAGKRIVHEGHHHLYEKALERYQQTIRRLLNV